MMKKALTTLLSLLLVLMLTLSVGLAENNLSALIPPATPWCFPRPMRVWA